MQYSYVKGLDKKVSKMVFGTATPLLFAAVAPNATKADEDAAFALLDNVFAHGINTFDCAYGQMDAGKRQP